MSEFSERTYGLAGMFQAASLVQQVARKGEADRFAKNASVNSVLVRDSINALSVYSDRQGIELGLRQLRSVFNEHTNEGLELFGYVAGLSKLTNSLQRDPKKINAFISEVTSLNTLSGDELITGMADVYKRCLSGLEPRILVNGEHGLLQKEDVANQVRAFLLAGVRASYIWHQKGGKRWDFMFKRAKYVEQANLLLKI